MKNRFAELKRPKREAILIMKMLPEEKRRILKHSIFERKQMSAFIRDVMSDYMDKKEKTKEVG